MALGWPFTDEVSVDVVARDLIVVAPFFVIGKANRTGRHALGTARMPAKAGK